MGKKRTEFDLIKFSRRNLKKMLGEKSNKKHTKKKKLLGWFRQPESPMGVKPTNTPLEKVKLQKEYGKQVTKKKLSKFYLLIQLFHSNFANDRPQFHTRADRKLVSAVARGTSIVGQQRHCWRARWKGWERTEGGGLRQSALPTIAGSPHLFQENQARNQTTDWKGRCQ